MNQPDTSIFPTSWGLMGEQGFKVLADLHPNIAVFVVDSDRTVTFWSKGAENVLGYSKEEAEGSNCLKVNRCATCVKGCGLKKHGKIQGVSLQLYRADDETVTVQKFAKAFYDGDRFLGGIEMLVPVQSTMAARPKSDQASFHGIVSRSGDMERVFQVISNVAETDATVLVRGESGSGKELVARAIHAESQRNSGPFVAVNCAALTPSLVESELFGHQKGAFTGAISDRDGLFVQAKGGTLFLDEVAELSLDVQAKLLRVLEERILVPVGSKESIETDVRVIAATNKPLRELVKENKFREDLMYRLRVVPVFIPPLRERRTDIDLLVWHFIEERNRNGGRQILRIEPDVMAALYAYRWPGNVRELRNVIDYAFAVGRDDVMTTQDLPPEVRSTNQVDRSLSEEDQIRQALKNTGGHIGRAAELLGISRPTLWRKRKKYGI